MNAVLVVLFWTMVFLAVYPFAFYPLLLLAGGALVRRTVRKAGVTPTVGFIITARNEARGIREKIENTLALDYPEDKLEIIVASDASDDGTDEIARSFADRGVRLVALPARGGKSMAQNAALAAATGEIIVHTDATTLLEPRGLRMLVRSLADPTVGCVTSEDRSVAAGGGADPEGAGLYTRFEARVRQSEARLSSLIGVSGSFYAVRRELRPPLPPDVIDDFYVPLTVIRHGRRVVPEPEAVGIVTRSKDLSQEYARRVRTFLSGMGVFFRAREMLNPFRFGWTSFQLVSHKLLRWMLPFLLAGILLVSVLLAPVHWLYAALLAAQVLLLAAALAGRRMARAGKSPPRPFRLAYYFCLMNAALLDAWWKRLRGVRTATWEPTKR